MQIPAPTEDEAPAEAGEWSLERLRGELDRLDESLHGLLMERAEVVARLTRLRLKPGVALRPGREAEIIRRRLGRHRGPLPAATIVRIWRELLVGTTGMQAPFSVAVCTPERDGGETGAAFVALAREHFGALTPARLHRSPAQAIAEILIGTASVAVLPFPAEGDPAGRWWQRLGTHDMPRAHVVARLPFWAPRPEGMPHLSALVLSTAPPDPSGRDTSLFSLAFAPELSRTRLTASITAAGFALGPVLIERDETAGLARALVEVAGFVTEDDPRLARLDRLAEPPCLIGAYAIPEPEPEQASQP
ncbi:MAG TPA: chorismate mutase [Acetobacteraceae bacterium]|nr:chorismate mutase [Acetobacteraceae bacterium]